MYDPGIGRFLSPDPFVQAPYDSQSLNRYSYVFNNPLSFTDPSGFLTAPPNPDNANPNRPPPTWRGDPWNWFRARINWQDICGMLCDQRRPLTPVPTGSPSGDPGKVSVGGGISSAPQSTVGGNGGIPRLVIGFRGAGIGFLGLEGDTPSLAAFVEELGGEMYEHGPFSRAAAVRAARDFAAANPNGQIVLTGYSRGGRAAFVVANALGEAGIGVQALILFDPHDLNDSVLRLGHGNVANALNFYQQNPTTSILGGNPFSGRPLAPYMVGSPNHRRFTPRLIRGHSYTGELGVGHLNIVSTSLRRYEELIREALGQ